MVEMATSTITIQSKTVGMERTTSELNRMSAAAKGVAASTDRMSASLGTVSNRAHQAATQVNKASMQSANLFAQFNDISVMMATGQSPFILAIQQGTQINQVLEQMRNQGKSAGTALKAALGSMVDPVNLLTIGLIAGGVALGQWALKALRSGQDIKESFSNLEQAVKSFSKAVDDANQPFGDMLDKFGSASPVFQQVLRDLANIERVKAMDTLRETAESIESLTREFGQFRGAAIGNIFGVDWAGGGNITAMREIAPFIRQVRQDLEAMTTGTLNDMHAATLRVRDAFQSTVDVTGELTDGQREFHDAITNLIVNQVLAGAEIEKLQEGVKQGADYLGAWNEQYAQIRTYASELYQESQSIVQSYQDQAKLSELAIGYGKDSVKYAKELRQQYEASIRSSDKLTKFSAKQREEIVKAAMAAYDLAKAEGIATAEAQKYAKALEKQAATEQKRSEVYAESMADLNSQLGILEAINTYGEGSTQHLKAQRDAHEENARAIAEQHGFAEGLADDFVAATMKVYDLKRALDAAAASAKKVSSASKSTSSSSARSSSAARYKGATEGQQDRTSMSFTIPKNDPKGFPSLLRDYSEEVKKSWTDIRRDLERFAEQNSFDVNSFFSGSADSPGYWENFKNLAVDAWTGILTEAFSANGVGMTAMLKGVEGIFSKMNDLYNEAAAGFMGREKKSIEIFMGQGVKYAGMKVGELPVVRRGTNLWRRANVFTGGFVDYEDVDSGIIGRIGGNNSNAIARAYGVFKQFTPEVIKDLTTGPGSAQDQMAQKNGGKLPFSLTSIDYAGDVAAPEITLSDRVGTSWGGTHNVRYRKEITGIAEVRQLLVEAAADVREPLKLLGDIIGGNTERLWEITEDFSISLGKTGKDTSNVQAELTSAFESYSEQIAGRILSHNETFRLAGETWTDALERLGKDFVSVTNTFLMLGEKSHQSVTIWNAKVKSEIAQLFGGADEFSSAASSYFDVAYSQAEQASQLRKYAKSLLSGLGISNLPDSREAYRQLVEAQDLNEAAGRERYAALIQLSGVFDFILPEFVDAVDGIGDVVDPAVDELNAFNEAMKTVSEGLTQLIREADQQVRTYERLAEALSKTAEKIRGSGQNETQTFDILSNRFRDLKRDAMTGDIAAMEQISDVATSYAKAWGSRARTAAEYQFRTAQIATALDNAAMVATDAAEMSRYESESLTQLKKAADNSAITNELVQQTVDAVGSLEEGILNALRTIYQHDTGEAPGFRHGGRHRGGFRVVGESGPELEATGAARYFSHAESKNVLGINDLRGDLKRYHEEDLSYRIRTDKNIRLLWETVDEWNEAGMPEERVS
jgi:hypothetical protein